MCGMNGVLLTSSSCANLRVVVALVMIAFASCTQSTRFATHNNSTYEAIATNGAPTGTPPTASGSDINTLAFFQHPDCSQPCVFGIEPGRTTLSQVEDILIQLNLQYEVRPTHIGGAGVYARQYDWENPTIVRVYNTYFPETRLTLDENDRVEWIFLAGGIVCPQNWFAQYPVAYHMIEEENSLIVAYHDLGLSIMFEPFTGSATVYMHHPDFYEGGEISDSVLSFPEDVSWRWTRSCASWGK